MQHENETNNSVDLVGKIVSGYTYSHEVYGEGFYNFDMQIMRLSKAHDVLPVTISERIIDKENFNIGSEVAVSGQVRSYNNFVDDQQKKNKLVLTVFARDIREVQHDDKNPNHVFLNGYICKAPVYRTTPFGREIADLLLAVNRSYNKSDYIPCIAWGRNAKFAGKLDVGSNIKIWGRMQSRNYQKRLENEQIIEKIAYEVSISKMEVSTPELES